MMYSPSLVTSLCKWAPWGPLFLQSLLFFRHVNLSPLLENVLFFYRRRKIGRGRRKAGETLIRGETDGLMVGKEG
jgi:hypothetical protein